MASRPPRENKHRSPLDDLSLDTKGPDTSAALKVIMTNLLSNERSKTVVRPTPIRPKTGIDITNVASWKTFPCTEHLTQGIERVRNDVPNNSLASMKVPSEIPLANILGRADTLSKQASEMRKPLPKPITMYENCPVTCRNESENIFEQEDEPVHCSSIVWKILCCVKSVAILHNKVLIHPNYFHSIR